MMGDFRASCQIKLHLRGKDYSLDLGWVNWSDYQYGADRRVVEFFENAWSEAHSDFLDDIGRGQKAETEKLEREELNRLKAKYEPPTKTRRC